jgi:hypothetical protein
VPPGALHRSVAIPRARARIGEKTQSSSFRSINSDATQIEVRFRRQRRHYPKPPACLLCAICRHLGNRPHAVKDHRELLHCRGTFVLSLHPKIAL